MNDAAKSIVPDDIDCPVYKVQYRDEPYSYNSKIGNMNLRKVLITASRGYCMYCYRRIIIDDEETGNLEHAIEKNVCPDKLTNCVPNIGIACSKCNQKYKRRGEKQRYPSKSIVESFVLEAKCQSETCKVPCDAYRRLKSHYIMKENAGFIMQPLGVSAMDLGISEDRPLLLQYNLFSLQFHPSKNEVYTSVEKKIILNHISLFGLNERRNNQVVCFIKDTIDNCGKYTKTQPLSLLVELFIDQYLDGKAEEIVLKICNSFYSYYVSKGM